jgi:hypothetical protein
MEAIAENVRYNLSTTGHGDHDRSWEDYIDFSEEKGLVFDSHDYTYGLPRYRESIRPMSEMSDGLKKLAKKAVIERLTEKGTVFEAGMWIGSTVHRNYNLPCKVVRSRKFRGNAVLINIVSKRDYYNREVYKALIVGNGGKYYVSPNCIQVDREKITEILGRMSLEELLDVLDENHYGHWNFAPYNRHLFSFPDYVSKYSDKTGVINIHDCIWGWMKKEPEVA